VVSTTRHSLVTTALGRIGLADLVDLVVGGDDVEHHKPDLEPYARALEVFGVAPTDAVAFEDSPSGVASAQAVGVYTLGFTGSCVPHELPAADERFASFTQLM
jgi:HAD superfamily hydrolase (TIGR01509 family)